MRLVLRETDRTPKRDRSRARCADGRSSRRDVEHRHFAQIFKISRIDSIGMPATHDRGELLFLRFKSNKTRLSSPSANMQRRNDQADQLDPREKPLILPLILP